MVVLRSKNEIEGLRRAAIEGAARTQLELAWAARLDKSTMVAVDALEAEGLVERRADPKDRRARIVVPTEAGRELLARRGGGAGRGERGARRLGRRGATGLARSADLPGGSAALGLAARRRRSRAAPQEKLLA